MFHAGRHPLCELHVHLEGCVWPRHVERWWQRSEFLFPPPSFPKKNSGKFDRFLEHLRFAYNFLNSEDAYAAVFSDYARQAADQGICYAELQINSALLKTWGIDLVAVLDRINEAAHSVQRAPTVRFIIDLPWQFSAAAFGPILKKLDRLIALGVRGLSLGGDESLARPADVRPLFRDARQAGLKVICHAGETTSPDFARNIVETLEPDRVTHAIALADWLTELGPRAPAVDVCLSSNLMLGVIQNLREHPLPGWVKAGVPVNLSTDDPGLFGITLKEDYELARLLCPELFASWDRIERTWVASAIDREAARHALAAAKSRWW